MASTYTARPGPPCWYELGADDLEAASEFYAAVLGWQTANEGGSDYVVGLDADGNGVAGMMRLADQEGEPPPNYPWTARRPLEKHTGPESSQNCRRTR